LYTRGVMPWLVINVRHLVLGTRQNGYLSYAANEIRQWKHSSKIRLFCTYGHGKTRQAAWRVWNGRGREECSGFPAEALVELVNLLDPG
jgi:hypothetical protein